MQKISAVIITRNEERNIGRCLDSIKSISDDIVIIDAESTDRTAEICSKYEVNFVSLPWQGYSESKNYGNKIAKYDMILSIDADETITEELAESIRKIKEQEKTGFYKFNRLTSYCGHWIKHSGWYPDRKLRIFDRRQAKWEGQIHEKLKYDENIKVVYIKGDSLHYSYYTIAEHLTKMNQFTEIAANELYVKGKRCSIFKQVFKTKLKFLSIYFWKLGILDGYYGLVIAVLSAMSEFVKYSKLRSLYRMSK